MKAFYAYLWLREKTLTPYYAGKGHGNRAFTSDSHGVKCPKDKSRIIVQEFASEKEAFAAEKFLIAFYGRKDNGTGCLRNLTDGGENPPSAKGKKFPPRSAEHCRKISETRKRLFASGALVSWNQGRPHPESTRKRISEAKLGTHSEAISRGQIERRRKNPEHLETISALGAVKSKTPEAIAKFKRSMKLAWQKRDRSQWGERFREFNKTKRGVKQTPEHVAKRIASRMQKRGVA